jgi:hypothetical protein
MLPFYGSLIDPRILSLIVGAESFTEAMKIGCETYHTLKNVIKKKYGLDGKEPKHCKVRMQMNKIPKCGINEYV